MLSASAIVLTLGACAAGKPPAAAPPDPATAIRSPAPEEAAAAAQRRHAEALATLPPVAPPKGRHPPIEHSGRTQKGKASYYAHSFDGRTMANGRAFNPHGNAAASKTLPLGTTAKVVNSENGKSANVTIQDRGPFIDGRVIDVTPAVAAKLDMKKKGVVPVEVKPITVPQPNGKVALGAGAAGASSKQVKEAVQATKDLPKH